MAKKRLFFLLFLLLSGVALPGLARDVQQKGQPLFNLGVFAYENGDYQTAENYFIQALSYDNNDAYLNYYLGKVYLAKSDYTRAALYFDKAANVDKNLPDLAYHWAYTTYKMNDFTTAGRLFESLTRSEPDNALAHYYAGMSLYKQDKYQQALKYLDQAAELNTPARYNADFYAGCCHLRLDDLSAAKKRLTRVEENAEEGKLRKSAGDLLERINRLENRQLRRYSLIAKLGWEYDDNEVLEPIDNNDLYAEESDHIFSAYLSTAYDFVRTEKIVLGAGYSHYWTFHDEFDRFDLSGSLFDIYARYRIQAYTFSLSYNPDYYWLDSESYLARHEAKATVSREFGKVLTELTYSYQRDNNIYDSEQDGHANEGFFRCRYDLPGNRGALRAGAGYEVNAADHPDYDFDKISTELAARINLPWGIYCGLCWECRFTDYDHPDSDYDKKREDAKYIGNILFSRNIADDRMAAHIGYEYTRNNSNIDDFNRYGADYEYESNAVKVFLTFEI